MYQEIRNLIQAQGCEIQKRRGLQIKKALASFYGDEQVTMDALDLCRELVEDGMNNIVSRRSETTRSYSSEGYLPPHGGQPATQTPVTRKNNLTPEPAQQMIDMPKESSPAELAYPPYRFKAPYHETKLRDGNNSGQEQVAQQPQDHRNAPSLARNGQPSWTQTVGVLSKLSTRFEDRSDKYGGDDGENWEDIYTSYMSCAFEWGVSEDAALRNIENILAGEART